MHRSRIYFLFFELNQWLIWAYGILGMKGIVRIDYIISEENTIYVIEINSIPGMSLESIVPQMIKAQHLNLEKLLNDITL